MSESKSIVVVGDGWAALGLTGFLARTGAQVHWVSGSGSRVVSPMPGVEVGSDEVGGKVWARLAQAYNLEAGALTEGSFLREFRNKAFREPVWMKAPTPETRLDARNEILWQPEQVIAPGFEARFQLSLAELDGQVREQLTQQPNVERIEAAPLQSIQAQDGKVTSVTLASGRTLECAELYFADRWTGLSQIEGLPKGLTFARKREPMGILQAVFTHELPVAVGVQEGFFGSLPREAGEEIERHVWGYFSSDGMKSFWTICLSSEEVEDNHAIAKKLRRMKNTLDKMFTGTAWVPEGKADFLSNVRGEQVRFEESILFTQGQDPKETIEVKSLQGLRFLTDGYGPTSALRQVATALRASGLEVLAEEAPSAAESTPDPSASV